MIALSIQMNLNVRIQAVSTCIIIIIRTLFALNLDQGTCIFVELKKDYQPEDHHLMEDLASHLRNCVDEDLCHTNFTFLVVSVNSIRSLFA